MSEKAFYCYILACGDGSYYTGWTTDPQRRLNEHQGGRGGRYTRSRLPVRMVYLEQLPNRSAAMRREHAIKQMKRDKKEKLAGG